MNHHFKWARQRRQRLPWLGVLCVAAAIGACENATESDANRRVQGPRETPYRIVCTVGMVTDIVRQVAGDKATVMGIIGESVDPHLYQPTRQDLIALVDADIAFYSGLLLEGKMGDALIQVGRKRPVFAVTEDLPLDALLAPAEFAGHHDPHVWMDVSLWKQCAAFVAGALGRFDDANSAYYQANYEKLAEEFDRLDAYARSAIASIPESRRVLVTAHDAFNYFGRAYGIEVRGIQGISTESEAGIRDINDLVRMLVERQVTAVFVESSVSEKNVTALVEGAAAQGHQVVVGGTLFSDAMGPAGAYEGTYVGMIDHNVTTIVRALGGEAPERGMAGKLSLGD